MTIVPDVLQVLDRLGQLEFSRFQVELQCEGAGTLPAYLGSTLRGGLAMAVRRQVCTYGDLPCRDCKKLRDCDYPRLFEINLPGGASIPGMQDTPHPIIIRPPLEALGCVSRGDLLRFEVTLMGRAIQSWNRILLACREFPKVGLGFPRIPFRFVRAIGSDGALIADSDHLSPLASPASRVFAESVCGTAFREDLHLDFLTPLRLVHKGQIIRSLIEPRLLLTSACRRLWALAKSCDGEESEIDFRCLIDTTPLPQVKNQQLSWKPLARYSNRQSKSVDLSGLIGSARWSGVHPDWWPILVAMREFHVGKGAVMGLGRVELRGL